MTIEIDHTGLSVTDYEAAKAFYVAALAPLRVAMLMEFPASVTGDYAVCGLGADGKPFLWISGGGRTSPHIHIAIRAETREQVDAFYQAALAAGATDNGPPGLRPHYHENYYGAFIIDSDGHNIEAVCHVSPEAAARAAAAPRKRSAAKKSAAPKRRAAKKTPARRRTTAAKKPAARKRAAAKKPAAKRSAAKRTTTRRKPATRRRTTKR